MGWQAEIFERLKDREWHLIGDLFDQVEAKIPLHFAMRHAVRSHGPYNADHLPDNSTARWKFFLQTLGAIGVEADNGKPRGRKYTDHVRLRYLPGRACEQCGGPVIKAGWAGRGKRSDGSEVICLGCTATPALLHIQGKAAGEFAGEFAPVMHMISLTPVIMDRPAKPPAPPEPSPRDVYQGERAAAAFLKNNRLRALSVSRIVKMLRGLRGDFNQLLRNFGQHPLSFQELVVFRLLTNQTHPP